jgi:hypothetical protein
MLSNLDFGTGTVIGASMGGATADVLTTSVSEPKSAARAMRGKGIEKVVPALLLGASAMICGIHFAMIGHNDRNFRPIGGLVTLAGIVALGLFLSREDPKKVQANNYQPPLHPHQTSTVAASMRTPSR